MLRNYIYILVSQIYSFLLFLLHDVLDDSREEAKIHISSSSYGFSYRYTRSSVLVVVSCVIYHKPHELLKSMPHINNRRIKIHKQEARSTIHKTWLYLLTALLGPILHLISIDRQKTTGSATLRLHTTYIQHGNGTSR